jgi:protein SCO1/2
MRTTIIEQRRTILLVAGVFVGVLLLLGGGLFLTSGSTERVGTLGIGGPFKLEDGLGRTITDRDLRGRYLLVYFGYTYCPDVCPTTLNEVATAMEKLGPKAAEVQPVFITVDPERDTPTVVKNYVAAFSPKLLGLTGTPEQIAQVAKAYRVYYEPHRAGTNAGDYTVDHSSLLYLMGPDGVFVAPIRADESGEAMAADVAKHLT